jgi:hypothetical protein|tara:strand:- start:644 stop:2029 length:1386 start_codon:yes stop_codon:yes gene_type:complete
MESLSQGIFFSTKKISFQSKDPIYLQYKSSPGLPKAGGQLIEGFVEGMGNDDWKIFSNQAISYSGGSNKGTYQNNEKKFMTGTLEECKTYIKDKGSYLGLEYVKDTKKAYFLKQQDGDLPRNNGRIPTLIHKNGVETWLKLNNGMPEAKEEKLMGDDAISQLDLEKKQKFSELENQFNGKLNTYKTHMTTILEKTVSEKSAASSNLKNSVRKLPAQNGNPEIIYYISGHGVKRKFGPGMWEKKGAGCTEPSGEVTSDQLNQLPSGQNMQQGEDCRTGGINVTGKNDGGGVYWVDKNGQAHLYSDFAGTPGNPGRHASCPSTVKKIDDAQIGKIPKGKNWTKDDPCIVTSSLGTDAGKNARATNDELMDIVKQMKDVVDSQDTNVLDDLDTKKAAQRKALITKLTALKKKRAEIAVLRQSVDAADYNVRDKKIRAEGIQIKYLAWTLAGVTLASMAIKMMNK